MIEKVLCWALVSWTLFAALYQLVSFASLFLLLRRRIKPPGGARPRCTFLRPLRGVDDSKEANLEDLCRFGIPIVAGVQSLQDPAMGLVRRVQLRNPEAEISVRAGKGPSGANRKVANLIQMLPLARGDILIFTDADVRLHPSSLDAILTLFEDASVGLVTFPYRAMAGKRLVDRLDVLPNNTIFLPSVALAERLEGVRFALGACIALRRDVLAKIGGLHFLLDMLPDDYALAAAVRKAGYESTLAPVLLDHCVTSRGWLSMTRRHLRWARTIHSIRPWAHLGTLATQGLPPALVLGLLGGALNLSMLATWLIARLGSSFCLRGRLGLTAKDLLFLPAADLWNFLVFVLSLFPTAVWWNDRRLVVGRGGIILSVREKAPGEGPQAKPAQRPPFPMEAPQPSRRAPTLTRAPAPIGDGNGDGRPLRTKSGY